MLKIIKHCQDESSGGNELVQGVLLGLVDVGRKCLEVTNCFPIPRRTDGDEVSTGKSGFMYSLPCLQCYAYFSCVNDNLK